MADTRLAPLRIAHVTHTLANGMRVVVHEDHTAPIVAVHVMFHVGSRDERPGRTGLAHLLEHLLFEGSANCPKGQFDRLLEQVGGTNNGSTWLDRTNYYEVVPSHAVELALWLERERMGFFLPVLDQEMLDVQRGVVINERRQSYENRPYGLADERLHQLLFSADHPYSWPTIGYVPDLEAATLEDARDFFSAYYTPANAVLVLAGDVAPEAAFQLAERYFGDLPGVPRPAPARIELAPDLTAAARQDTLLDRVSFPRMYRAHTVGGYGTREWVIADVLTYLLSDGESSRLQRVLVRDRQLAQEVDVYLYPTRMSGILGVVATSRSGVAVERLEDAVQEVIVEVAEGGIPEEELVGSIRRARRDQLAGLSNVEDRAEELAYAATVLGGAERIDEVLDLYSSVTSDEVREAAATLASAGGARLRVLPRPGAAEEVD